MRIDVDGRSVDVKIGALIGPDPAIERPLTEALALAALLDNRILQTSAARGRFEVIKPLSGAAVRPKPIASRSRRCGSTRISWNISVMLEVYRSAHPRG